jgi:hypothetical protein
MTDGKDNESENNFFIIYRYLKKISADNFIENKKKNEHIIGDICTFH